MRQAYFHGVVCDVCGREVQAVRLKDQDGTVSWHPPPTWVTLSPACCEHVQHYTCDNAVCQKRAAVVIREHHHADILASRTVQVPIAGSPMAVLEDILKEK